jgi:putative membrane protein
MIASAYAHATGELHHAPGLWNAWTLDPLVLVPLALAGWLYSKGIASMWQHGVGRGIARSQAACFGAGFVALFFSLVWPLDVLGELLFSAHMAQHLVLMNIAAPLLVLGAPLGPMLAALPRSWQRGIGSAARTRGWRTGWRWSSGLAFATILQQVVMWGWHTPSGIAVALQSDPMHIAMHVSLILVALVFWTAVLNARIRRPWAAVAALFVTFKASGLPCIVLLLRDTAIYGAYGASAAAWGLAPEADEQLGWGIMMAIGSSTYLAAAIVLLAAAFMRLERRHPAGAAGRAELLEP